ncbi:MAG: tetratricopeptide repeat protein [Candidatus Aminicenantales bacterium]
MIKKTFAFLLIFPLAASFLLSQKEGGRADSYFHFLRGSQLWAEGLLEEAAAEMMNALKGSEDPAFVYSALASLYFEMWEWDKSEDAARKALSLDLENISAHRVLGRIFMSRALSFRADEPIMRDLLQQAKEEFLKIISISADDEEAYSSLGKISLALSDLREAEKYFSRFTELNPFSEKGFLNLGEIQLELSKFSDAEHSLEKALSLNPRSFNGYILLGRVYEHKEDWFKAAELYRRALRYFPRDPILLNRLGFCLYFIEDYSGALQALEQVLEQDPSNYYALLTRAKIFQRTGKLKEAEILYRRLLKQKAKSVEVHLNLAILLENKGDREGALAEYIELLRMEKNPPLERRYFYHFRIGVLHERLKNFDKAEDYLRKAVEIDPESGEALNYLGYMLVERGNKLKEAINFIKRALAVEPDNGAYLDSLGWAYYKIGNFKGAEIYLRQAIQKLKDDPVINDHLGDLYFRLGKRDKALSYWKKALVAGIEDADAVKKKIEKALKK